MKKMNAVLYVTFVMVLAVVLTPVSANAIITVNGDGPDSNTNLPPELMDMVGHYGPVLGTIISSNCVATAAHVLGASDRFTYRGVDYMIIGSTNVAFDVAILFVEGSFPTNAIAKLYEGTEYLGMEVTVIGKGGSKGEPICRQVVTNVVVTNIVMTMPNSTVIQKFTHSEDFDQFEVVGDAGLGFVVEKTTDFNNWRPVLTNAIPDTGIAALTIPIEPSIEVEQSKNLFYRVKSLTELVETVTTNTVTNNVTIGWNATSPDNVTRCAKTKLISRNGEDVVFFRFEGPNGVSFSSGDSGGPMFNTAGELVGVGYASALGPYSWDGVNWFFGHVMDRAGLLMGYYNFETGSIVQVGTYPENSGGNEVLYSIPPVQVIKNIIGG